MGIDAKAPSMVVEKARAEFAKSAALITRLYERGANEKGKPNGLPLKIGCRVSERKGSGGAFS